MKIVIAGGTGFLGGTLLPYFTNDEVVILTRNHRSSHENVRYATWNAQDLDQWYHELDGADVLINLNGKSVDCRYTEKNKRLIYETRLKSTSVLGEAILNCERPPAVWINASSATIYQHSEDKMMDEYNGDIGDDFSMDVCKSWEQVFYSFQLPFTRQIAIRTSLVLGKESGALPSLLNLSKIGLGGSQGSGNQWFSWLHEQDFARAVLFLIAHNDLSGNFNITAPEPLPNKEFMKQLRRQLGVPFGISMPTWMVYLGAFIMQTEPELILKSRYVYPKRLTDAGFQFKYPEIVGAFRHLLR